MAHTPDYEIEIISNNECESSVDYITEIKKRLDFIESILKIKVKHKKNKNHKNGNEV